MARPELRELETILTLAKHVTRVLLILAILVVFGIALASGAVAAIEFDAGWITFEIPLRSTPAPTPADQGVTVVDSHPPAPTKRTKQGLENAQQSCQDAPPQRLQVGEAAWVCTLYDRLIVHTQPSLDAPEVTRLTPGTQVVVVGGPECMDGYTWWKIQDEHNLVAWGAEGGDEVDPYFLCPLK